jgi:glutamine amidotransferase
VPGIYRDILPAWNDPNLRSLTHQVRAPKFFAHVRASTGTATSRYTCHPFGFGPWLFMHNGQIGGHARIERRLEARLDDEHYRARLGTTDSELFFHLLLTGRLWCGQGRGENHAPRSTGRAEAARIGLETQVQ